MRTHDDREITQPRSFLWHRKWHRVAIIGFTDDRKHGTCSTQHFLNEAPEWIKTNTCDLQSDNKDIDLFIHSDNAASHFKNCKTMNWLSRVNLKGLHPTWLRRAVWDIGCPGHGVRGFIYLFIYFDGFMWWQKGIERPISASLWLCRTEVTTRTQHISGLGA